ncbi:MAG: SCO family protein [Candidatus Synoicihabitans palmerolidicus]|nr:SCO family protein [Candidatus Synoicihabitans palmerolidicus]
MIRALGRKSVAFCILFSIWGSAGLVFSGCGRSAAPVDEAKLEVPGRPVTGQVVKIDAERGTLLVDHDEIPDYMPAMVMEFRAGPGDIANLEAGQHIRGRLVEEANGKFALAHIWVVEDVEETWVSAAAAALRQDTTIRGRKAYRAVGENLPDFSLYDQTGAVVDPSLFRGKKVIMNFIYTRCPIATMCPAAVSNMMAVQTAVAEAGHTDNLELISITFDPEFDTPGVLSKYAAARGIDTGNYSLLTGPESAIQDLLRQFGVLAQVDGPLIAHTLTTLLIDEQGRIIDRADGSQWDVQQFVRKIVR